MSGAKETMLAQSSNNNNLANASTPGFLSDLQQFRSMPVFDTIKVSPVSVQPVFICRAYPLTELYAIGRFEELFLRSVAAISGVTSITAAQILVDPIFI